jgi:hypothetical protein
MPNAIISKIQNWIVQIFVVALVVSLALAGFGTKESIKDGCWGPWTITKAIAIALWIILPPIWFWWEFHMTAWDERYDAKLMDKRERFAYGQDLSAKVWLAVSSALLMLYFGKDIR